MKIPACLSILLGCLSALAAGIPEPGLTLYGVVRQNLGGSHARLTTGTLEITITPTVGTPLVLQTTLTNLNNQFSFVLQVPFETSVPGFTASSGALALTPAASNFTRNPVKVNNVNATIVAPATAVMSFGQANRGSFERMDVDVTLGINDVDGDGLPNEWETQYFGNATLGDPNADGDGDGFNNRSEYLAGTDPTNPTSVLALSSIVLPGSGGTVVNWIGAPNRTYSLYRSSQPGSGYTVVAANVFSATGSYTFTDPGATGAGNRFYRAQVE